MHNINTVGIADHLDMSESCKKKIERLALHFMSENDCAGMSDKELLDNALSLLIEIEKSAENERAIEKMLLDQGLPI